MAAPMAAHSVAAKKPPWAGPGGMIRTTEGPAKHHLRSRCYPQKCQNIPGKSSGEARRRPEATPSARAMGPRNGSQLEPSYWLDYVFWPPSIEGKFIGRVCSWKRKIHVFRRSTERSLVDRIPFLFAYLPYVLRESISGETMAATHQRMLDVENLGENSLQWLPKGNGSFLGSL